MDGISITMAGHLSFAAAALSFLMKDIILLRVIAILSSLLGIVYNFFATAEPLWLVIFWLSIFIVINLYQTITILFESRLVEFTESELDIRNKFFKQLSLTHFKKLINLGKYQTFPEEARIIRMNQDTPELKLIISGAVKIKQNDKILATLRAGSFIGEISFMSGSKASANVSASEETKVIAWDQMGLRKLLLANPSLHLIFSEIINKDLSQKLSTKQ